MLKVSLAFALLVSALAAAQTRTPVLVELFTSEGCSSCPPADQLLIQLEQKQPVAGVEIIALGEHVDYWDRLGWKDRFSSSQFTSRQNAYASNFGKDSVYTPQMVVNGMTEFVGNDANKALQAIQGIAQRRIPHPEIHIERNGDRLHVAVVGAGQQGLNVFCAITERDLSTRVNDGENRGRELRHTAVVRDLRKLGSTRDGGFTIDVPLKLSSDWRPENLRAVIFVQRGNGGEVTGVAQLPLAK